MISCLAKQVGNQITGVEVLLRIRDINLRPEARSYEVFSRYIGCTAEEITRDMLRRQIGAYF